MKRLLMFLTVVSTVMFSCTDESVTPDKSDVSFSFTLGSPDSEDGRIQNELPPGTSLLVTVEGKLGSNVLSNHKIEIIQFGDGYTTEPLALPSGSYVLKDFILVNNASQALYAIPKKGSPLAKLVHHSLPYNFTIGANKVNTLDLEVIDVTTSKPEDFGYVSFDIDVVRPLQVSVFTLQQDGHVLTAATAFILKGTDTVSTHTLGAKVNTIPFKGDPNTLYTLVIKKEGYRDFSKSFSYDALVEELDGKPLSVTLSDQTSGAMYLQLDWFTEEVSFILGFTSNATVVVNWGDGTSETITSSTDVQLTHHYEYDDTMPDLVVTGDLYKIRSFEKVNGLTQAYLNDLVNLEKVVMRNVNTFNMNFSKNNKLKYVDIQGADIAVLEFPQTHNISYLNMQNVSLMFGTPEQVDTYIYNIYYNSVHKGIVDGYFNLKSLRSHDYEGQFIEMIMPSSAGETTLGDLRIQYRWTVEYGI